METSSDLKKVALNDIHVSLGGKMVPFAGYNMPVRYSSDLDEHHTVRNAVGVFDVSHMGEFMVEGPGALPLIQKVTSNDASRLVNGQAQYSCLPNEKGGIVDDLLVYKMADERYMLVVNASNIEKDWNWISKHNSFGARLTNISDQTSLFAVQGPKAVEVLQKITSVDLAAIPYYHFTVGKIGGLNDVIISATGYTGAGGFELYVKNEDAETLWNKIFEAGKGAGIKPIGLGARDTLRLEMGFCLYGNDINDETSPIEAGLGWITKFTKDFINSDALRKQKESGTSKKLIGFEMIDRGIPRAHYELFNSHREKIGEVTSGSMSPTLGRGVGLGYVNAEYSMQNVEISVDVRGKLLNARIVKLPFLKK